MNRNAVTIRQRIIIVALSLVLSLYGSRVHAADPAPIPKSAVPTKKVGQPKPDAKQASQPLTDATKTSKTAEQSPTAIAAPSTLKSQPPSQPASTAKAVGRVRARVRVTVEHSVTVVRHDVKRQANLQANAPQAEVSEHDAPEVVEYVEVIDVERVLAPPATRNTPSGRASRQAATPRSWSIHGNPAWAYHPPSLRYQPKPSKRYQPRRDWTYHPAASRKYKSKRSRSYQRR